MKNILLATTALVFTAGIASAEITFSGSGQFGLKNTSQAGVAGADAATLNNEIDVKVSMSLAADNGMTFKQSFGLNADTTARTADTKSASSVIDSAVGSVSMNGLTLSVGSVGEADVQGGISDVGYDDLGADDLANAWDGKNAHNVNLTYAMGDFTLAYSQLFGGGTATATPLDSYSLGAKWTSGALTLGAGYHNIDDDQGATTFDDGAVTSGYIKYVAGPATIQAMTSTLDSELVGTKNKTTSGVSIDYAASDVLTVTVTSTDNNEAGQKGTSGLGVTYDLGGGAKFKAGYATYNGPGTGKTVDYAVSSAGFVLAF